MNDNGGENADSSNLSSPTITVVPTPSPSTSSNAKSNSSSTTTNSNINNSNRMEQQMKKLKDANTKYKDLLKLAKERIQTQEEELTNLKKELKVTKEEKKNEYTKDNNTINASNGISSSPLSIQTYEYDLPNIRLDSIGGGGDQSSSCSVVKIHQRIKLEKDHTIYHNGVISDDNNITTDRNHLEQTNNDASQVDIWAFIEYEMSPTEENTGGLFASTTNRFSRWRRFTSEGAFSDHIRRDSGEPIHVPPYSLSPIQSQQIEEEAKRSVTHVTEEFRRFRVRAEIARKQADATVRALQNKNVQNAQRHIEGQDIASELAQARTDHEQLATLKAEMVEQEAHWKSAYDVLLAENNQLKSSGSEALLAAQWRQRYETCLSEKRKLETALTVEKEKSKKEDSGKYEAKYKDLKESFKIYRKKAKEIFDAQQNGDTTMINLVENGTDEAKISYLRNLMVNYLASDPTVREHMEAAIGTVLKFTNEDRAKIAKQKQHNESSWFG